MAESAVSWAESVDGLDVVLQRGRVCDTERASKLLWQSRLVEMQMRWVSVAECGARLAQVFQEQPQLVRLSLSASVESDYDDEGGVVSYKQLDVREALMREEGHEWHDEAPDSLCDWLLSETAMAELLMDVADDNYLGRWTTTILAG